MSAFVIFAVSTALLFLASNKSGTQIVLLDNASEQNAIVVTTEGGSVTIDTPYEGTHLDSAASTPAAPEKVSKEALLEEHRDTFEIAPPKPLSYLLYFNYDSTELTPESQQTLAAMLATVSACPACAVDIIGHTDRRGEEAYNMALSLQRTEAVRKLLESHHIAAERLNSHYYGEYFPLLATPDGVAEPKNRRVELMIR